MVHSSQSGHIGIHLVCHKFLHFYVGDNHYQFRVFSFGIATAPVVFTKVFAVMAAQLK